MQVQRLPFVLLLVASCRMREDPPRPEPPPAPRYAFIDGGANVGQTVLAFEKSTLFTKHAWSMVSFEPNPGLVPLIPRRPWLTVEAKALWTRDEPLDFEFSEDVTLGGSVMPTIVRFPVMKKVTVDAIDFGRWLRRNFRKEDVVYVKLDIEGAE
ncbi:MAG: hypothetical protein ABI175_19200, partial [Polyangiales bacterium]